MLLPNAVPHDAFWNLRGNQKIFHAVDDAFEHQVHDVKQPNVPCKDATPALFAVTPNFLLHMRSPRGERTSSRGYLWHMVSFVDAFMRPLLEATARLLYSLCAIAFRLAVAKGGVYDLLTRVRKFFQEGIDETSHCGYQVKTSVAFSPAFLLLNSSKPGNYAGILSITTRPGH